MSWTALRAVRSLHENEALVAWWAAQLARLGAWTAPRRRRVLLSLVSLALLAAAVGGKRWLRDPGLTAAPLVRWALGVPCVLGVLAGAWLAAVRFERLPAAVRRRPQVALHAVFWTLLGLLWLTAGATGGWRRVLALVIAVLPLLLWRCGYLLKTAQRAKLRGTGPLDHLFYLWPLWRGGETPYGKGWDHLARHEAGDATALARAQLAGVKLLVLAQLWRGAMLVMRGLVYGEPGPVARLAGGWNLGVPRLERLLAGSAEASLPVAWASLVADLVWSTLELAVKGHDAIGLLRLCGFAVFRNTYKPLLAESVVEFWNRYYYYFKELLVEFFFYPTFTRWRVRPWLRTGLAIFAAAFAGNLYYHLIQQTGLLVRADSGGLWWTLHARVIYCLLLAGGIWVSMLREQGRRGAAAVPAGRATRLRRIAGVWLFYSLIHVWGAAGGAATLAQRNRFFASLLLP